MFENKETLSFRVYRVEMENMDHNTLLRSYSVASTVDNSPERERGTGWHRWVAKDKNMYSPVY